MSDTEAARSEELAKDRAVRAGLPEEARKRIGELMKGGGKLHPPSYGGAPVVITHGGRSHHFIPKEDERDRQADELARATKKMGGTNAVHNKEDGYHYVIVPRQGVNEAKNRYSEGDPKVPYILTPTGWRVLEEALTDAEIKKIEDLRDGVKRKASQKLKELQRARFLNRGRGGEKTTKEEPTKELKESQMELLEALCDAGYLSEEQLVEGVRSFLARSAQEHERRAQLADREAALIRKALKAGRGGALLGPNGTDAQAYRKLRRKEKEGEGAGKAAGRRTALARLINRLKDNS